MSIITSSMNHADDELGSNQDDIITPQDFDVLSGQRGRGFLNHPGNCRYKGTHNDGLQLTLYFFHKLTCDPELIDLNFTRYEETVLNDRKRLIAYDIIDEIIQNGRFLTRTKSSVIWFIQNREASRRKVTKALQDKIRKNGEQLVPSELVIQSDQFNVIVHPQNTSSVGSGLFYLEDQSEASTTEPGEKESKERSNQFQESSPQVTSPHPHIDRQFLSNYHASKFCYDEKMEPEEKDGNQRKEQVLVSQPDPSNMILRLRAVDQFPLDDTTLNIHGVDVANAEPLRQNCDRSMCQLQRKSASRGSAMRFDNVNWEIPVKASKCDPNQDVPLMIEIPSVISQITSQATTFVTDYQYCETKAHQPFLLHFCQENETTLYVGDHFDYLDLPGDEIYNQGIFDEM